MQLVSINFDIGQRFYRASCGFATRIAISVQGEHALGGVAAACRLQLQR
jgi:hypothetical protein